MANVCCCSGADMNSIKVQISSILSSAVALTMKFHPPRPLKLVSPSLATGNAPMSTSPGLPPDVALAHEVPPAEAAEARVSFARRRQRPDVHLPRLYPRGLGVGEQPVHERPVAHKDDVAVGEARLRLLRGVVAGGLRRDTVGDEAAAKLQVLGRLGAVYDDPVPVEDVAPGVPDVLKGVHDPALILRSLEDVPELRPAVRPDLLGHALHLFPGLRRFGEAGLLQEVRAVVEHPGVGKPRDAVGLALELDGLDRAF